LRSFPCSSRSYPSGARPALSEVGIAPV
jgi:hypothetical protein